MNRQRRRRRREISLVKWMMGFWWIFGSPGKMGLGAPSCFCGERARHWFDCDCWCQTQTRAVRGACRERRSTGLSTRELSPTKKVLGVTISQSIISSTINHQSSIPQTCAAQQTLYHYGDANSTQSSFDPHISQFYITLLRVGLLLGSMRRTVMRPSSLADWLPQLLPVNQKVFPQTC